jgi:cytochrome c oxidase cbb3-type subunit 2
MNSGPLLYLGLLLSMALSFWGMVLSPQMQMGRKDVTPAGDGRQLYPAGRMGLAKAGADVYRSHGCAECHTQQVRPEGYGSDFERGWGVRRTVAQDYLRDNPVMLGSLRMGPDLANIGVRQPDVNWHLNHLYHPKTVVPTSTMPPYAFLFETRQITGQPSPEALTIEGEYAPEAGYEVIPTDQAWALVAYLKSLNSEVALFEAPLPVEPVDTNAPPEVPAVPINPEDFE